MNQNQKNKAFDLTREFIKKIVCLDVQSDEYSDYIDEKKDIDALLLSIANIGYHRHMGLSWTANIERLALLDYNRRLKETKINRNK